MVEVIDLPGYGQIVIALPILNGSGIISSDLHIEADMDQEPSWGKTADVMEAIVWNAMVDVMESMILAHAIAGVEVTSEAYVSGIMTAIEAASNNV